MKPTGFIENKTEQEETFNVGDWVVCDYNPTLISSWGVVNTEMHVSWFDGSISHIKITDREEMSHVRLATRREMAWFNLKSV